MSDECRMQNAECGIGTATGYEQLATGAQDVKERGRRRRPGKSGLPIIRGAARPVHFSRNSAQRKMRFHAVGGVICRNGNSVARATPARSAKSGSAGQFRGWALIWRMGTGHRGRRRLVGSIRRRTGSRQAVRWARLRGGHTHAAVETHGTSSAGVDGWMWARRSGFRTRWSGLRSRE